MIMKLICVTVFSGGNGMDELLRLGFVGVLSPGGHQVLDCHGLGDDRMA